MKFKVGDKVKIKSKEDIEYKIENTILDITECAFNPGMGKYTSKVAQIEAITQYGAYKLDIDDGEYNWSDYMLEPYAVEMRKSDLKDEDYVTFRNEIKAIKSDKWLVGKDLSLSLSDYNNRLEHNFNSNYDIVRVDRPTKYKTIYKNDEILDSTEKKYLTAVIAPFRDKIKNIAKIDEDNGKQYICICYYGGLYTEKITLPYFKSGTMYVGMKSDKEYTLKELGL